MAARKPAAVLRKLDGHFETALAALRVGARVRRRAWMPGAYVQIMDRDHRGRVMPETLMHRDHIGNLNPATITRDELFASDWELVPDPTPVTEEIPS